MLQNPGKLHSLLFTLIGHLKFVFTIFQVPLIIFKREKEVARKLEFDGLYISEEPRDDDIAGQWDRLVISCPSFPSNYWDKFVKKKVTLFSGLRKHCYAQSQGLKK